MDGSAQAWLAVPARVRELFNKYAGAATAIAAANPGLDSFEVKTAEVGPVRVQKPSLFGPASSTSLNAQRAVGGPNPLTAMLLGAALGGGLGYGGGWLMRKLMPDYFRDDMEKFTLPAGALAGAGIAGAIHSPNIKMKGLFKGLTTPSLLQDPTQDYPGKTAVACDVGFAMEKLAIAMGSTVPSYLNPGKYGISGGAYVPNIDVDEWGRVVTKDPFLTPQEKAIAIGIPSAAAMSQGSRFVSPAAIGMTTAQLATNAFVGKLMGRAFGTAIAPILRLQPKAVDDLGKAGILAGIIRTVGIIG